MKEIFVIERLLSPGIWELFSNAFYTDKRQAFEAWESITNKMLEKDKTFCARITTLKLASK